MTGKLILAIGCLVPALVAQSGDWPMFGDDPAGTRKSPLTQINSGNVAKLKLAWKYRFRSEKEK